MSGEARPTKAAHDSAELVASAARPADGNSQATSVRLQVLGNGAGTHSFTFSVRAIPL